MGVLLCVVYIVGLIAMSVGLALFIKKLNPYPYDDEDEDGEES